MTRLSQLRSRLFAHRLTSSISDNFEDSEQQGIPVRVDRIDVLLTQARVGYETMLSQTSGERVDQRRSASRGQITYRQGVVVPAAVVLVLDITVNWQYHQVILQQINQIINHTIRSCEQLGIECIILYPDQGEVKEYVCEGLEQTIKLLNAVVENSIQENAPLATTLRRYYNEYYNHHVIVLSDRHSWSEQDDGAQTQHLLDTHQALGYIRNYPSPIIHRGTVPEGLIQLKR